MSHTSGHATLCKSPSLRDPNVCLCGSPMAMRDGMCRGWFGDFETIATHKMTHTARKYISCTCPKHQRSCPGSTVVPSSRANRPVQPRAYAFVTNEQQQARSHTHLRAPGPRPTRMRTRHGSDLRPLQVWATSSKHPRSPETAHSSKQRAARDATAYNALHAHACRGNRMPWDDHRSQGIAPPHCTMSA